MSDAAPRRFATTRWTLIARAAGDPASSQARDALAELCEAYWYPVYAFIRRTGKNTDDAQDLTQAFFARVLEKGGLRNATPERGRFRSYLLGAVRNFLANEYDRQVTHKRGGGKTILPLDFG